MKVAIVTGASSGIGWEAALEIDRRFRSLDEIWIVGRNEEKLRILSRHLKHAWTLRIRKTWMHSRM